MKVRLADYVADFLVKCGICHCFAVTGGGAMYLNDALGHKSGLECIYNHHEQACAIAAEAYARINNKIAAVCVTTGPGGTNAITGVLGGWLDSVPMLIISGQVRYDTTRRGMGVQVRAGGDQEFDITAAVKCMTKYCEMIEDPTRIRYALERALYLATHGRPGPCWIDIPVDFQGGLIETDSLAAYDPSEDSDSLPPSVCDRDIDAVIEQIKSSRRPVLYAGNGIRLSGGFEVFESVVESLNIPVVTGWNSIDAIPDAHKLYVGRGGIMGDRAGNFAVQNADLVLAVGNRLSIRQVGYNWKTWAKGAFVVMVDADSEELKKPTLHVDMPIHADAKDFLERLEARLSPDAPLFSESEWHAICLGWKRDYPVVQLKHTEWQGLANPYAFIKALSAKLPEGSVIVVGNGSACVVGSQAYEIKRGQRFIVNSGVASMGYGLPAAIGASVARDGSEVICITGDGSIQMNLQELQTILTNNLPIKIFVINNGGYHSIRQTQGSLFGDHTKVGIGRESRDLDFPPLEKLAWAYGYPYFACHSNGELSKMLDAAFSARGAVIAEVFVDTAQNFEPKSSARRLADGSLTSPPLEDLAPFLPREELEKIMSVSKKR